MLEYFQVKLLTQKYNQIHYYDDEKKFHEKD